MDVDMQVNDELVMPCAQCCRKHLSAAIASYADTNWSSVNMFDESTGYWHCLVARAFINLTEARQGYESHRLFAIGLLVQAEIECDDPVMCRDIRSLRLSVTANKKSLPTPYYLMAVDWYRAHLYEAEREYPDIRTAVDRDLYYRNNMSEPEFRQAEVNYRLAQLAWLDENIFGTKSQEKGEAHMATKKATKAATKKSAVKPATKAARKVDAVRVVTKSAKKAACKGGKCKK